MNISHAKSVEFLLKNFANYLICRNFAAAYH